MSYRMPISSSTVQWIVAWCLNYNRDVSRIKTQFDLTQCDLNQNWSVSVHVIRVGWVESSQILIQMTSSIPCPLALANRMEPFEFSSYTSVFLSPQGNWYFYNNSQIIKKNKIQDIFHFIWLRSNIRFTKFRGVVCWI